MTNLDVVAHINVNYLRIICFLVISVILLSPFK